jgi:pimeloyl-ACP methyl ester carboxylesterase
MYWIGRALEEIDAAAVLMTHSMSGAYGWKLLETHGDRIAAVVAMVPGGLGNIQPTGEVLSKDGDTIEMKLQLTVKSNMTEPFVTPQEWAQKKLMGQGSRFPRHVSERYLGSLCAIPPRLLYEQFNIAGSQLKVSHFTHYDKKRVLVLIGTHDVDHPPDVDKPIVDWLNANGAKAEFVQLSDIGISGNGHMMMLESNSDEIACFIEQWLTRSANAEI